MQIPVLGWGLKLGEFVPVDRDGRIESAQESVAHARAVLAKGMHITTFVEGTRSRDGRMLPFKKGPVLSREGDWRAVHSGFDLGNGDHDGERAACGSVPARRTSLFTRRSIRPITRRAKS